MNKGNRINLCCPEFYRTPPARQKTSPASHAGLVKNLNPEKIIFRVVLFIKCQKMKQKAIFN
jgi:hypothetical protein